MAEPSWAKLQINNSGVGPSLEQAGLKLILVGPSTPLKKICKPRPWPV